ncbi:hypothetical protein C4D60_Mb09t20590 [Musa balbisiana]|uniref:Uncharacterized protein n=1 Tax=Musa balbisiana TaxID=52838 RepID=A0A4S8IHX3_MUSBA|nr:hypothetical protein C4D60_Mb09t20590 [Musa balbisiana]
MASLYGLLHRPLSAAAAVAVTTALPDHVFSFSKQSEPDASPPAVPAPCSKPAACRTSISDVSLLLADNKRSVRSSFTISSPAILLTPYQYAKLANPRKNDEASLTLASSQPDGLYRWHLPDPKAYGVTESNGCSKAKSQTVVILLGWLGAKQKHLKKYADWYTSRGFHVVSFTLPLSDIVSYKVGGKVEQNVELLAEHLVDWVSEESGKSLVFHTFSNTGWLIYGVLIEKFQKQEPSVIGKIKGCIVDSAPLAAPDPKVWASGFSAALLKKKSVATKGMVSSNVTGRGTTTADGSYGDPKPTVTETALLVALKKFFEVVLDFPTINRRLSDVLNLLTSEQPKCPQLYIYSSADRVIPAKSVESFVERQRRAGHEVKACDFLSSPHVDHFRSHPGLYSSQLVNFLEDCVITCCRDSS